MQITVTNKEAKLNNINIEEVLFVDFGKHEGNLVTSEDAFTHRYKLTEIKEIIGNEFHLADANVIVNTSKIRSINTELQRLYFIDKNDDLYLNVSARRIGELNKLITK